MTFEKPPLVLYPDPRLKEISLPVEPHEDYQDFIWHMHQQMVFYEGIGISAPQFGVLKRIFLVQNIVMINPEILMLSKEQITLKEGCLSIPRVLKRVTRPESVHAMWYDEKGKAHSETLNGVQARVFQHEMDHLNGVLFVDYLSSFSQKWAFKKYTREQKVRTHEVGQ